MNARGKISVALAAAVVSVALYTRAFAFGYGWEFSSPADLRGWELSGAPPASIDNGALKLRGNAPFRLSSPFIDISDETNLFLLRYKSRGAGIVAIGLLTSKDRLITEFFRLPDDGETHDYKIYTPDLLSPDEKIERLIIESPANTELRLERAAFYRAGGLGLLLDLWPIFWKPEIIKASTINFASTPRFGGVGLQALLYCVVFIASAGALVLFVVIGKKGIKREGVVTALEVGFLIAGVVYTLRMDYNWLKVWQDDVKTLSGKSTDEKVAAVFSVYGHDYPDFLRFIEFAKGMIPKGEKVRPYSSQDDNMALSARYFFLPVLTSETGGYVWLYDGKAVSGAFDPDTGLLRPKDNAFAYRPKAVYGDKGAIFERMEAGK